MKASLKPTHANCCSSYYLVLQARNWLRDLVDKESAILPYQFPTGLRKVTGKGGEREGLC